MHAVYRLLLQRRPINTHTQSTISFWRRTIIKFYLLQPHPASRRRAPDFSMLLSGKKSKAASEKLHVYCIRALIFPHDDAFDGRGFNYTRHNHFLKNNFVLYFPAGAHVLCGRALTACLYK